MLETPLSRTLGIELPIFNAGMGGGVAGTALAAAVSNAGGLGVLGMGGLPAAVTREQIRCLRSTRRIRNSLQPSQVPSICGNASFRRAVR